MRPPLERSGKVRGTSCRKNLTRISRAMPLPDSVGSRMRPPDDRTSGRYIVASCREAAAAWDWPAELLAEFLALVQVADQGVRQERLGVAIAGPLELVMAASTCVRAGLSSTAVYCADFSSWGVPSLSSIDRANNPVPVSSLYRSPEAIRP